MLGIEIIIMAVLLSPCQKEPVPLCGGSSSGCQHFWGLQRARQEIDGRPKTDKRKTDRRKTDRSQETETENRDRRQKTPRHPRQRHPETPRDTDSRQRENPGNKHLLWLCQSLSHIHHHTIHSSRLPSLLACLNFAEPGADNNETNRNKTFIEILIYRLSSIIYHLLSIHRPSPIAYRLPLFLAWFTAFQHSGCWPMSAGVHYSSIHRSSPLLARPPPSPSKTLSISRPAVERAHTPLPPALSFSCD